VHRHAGRDVLCRGDRQAAGVDGADPADGGEILERIAVDGQDVGPLRCPSPQACEAREVIAHRTSAGRTAENHVQHILTKLGFQNRSQIAAWTARQGLRTPQA
jgi:hypothetical protein